MGTTTILALVGWQWPEGWWGSMMQDPSSWAFIHLVTQRRFNITTRNVSGPEKHPCPGHCLCCTQLRGMGTATEAGPALTRASCH